MSTKATTKTTIALFDRANSQLQKLLFFNTVTTIRTTFSPEPAYNAQTNMHQWRWPIVTVAIAETHYPPPRSAHIHCLVSINVQEALMYVKSCYFFLMEEFNCTLLLHIYIYVSQHFVWLPLCCHQSHCDKNVSEYCCEDSTPFCPPTSASDSAGQHNKIGGITFGAALVRGLTRRRMNNWWIEF